ncbi:MAG: hypothetical protein ACOYN4_13200 [Bacteroidales bacterium]
MAGFVSIFRLSTLHTPFVLRAASRLTGFVRVFMSYIQYLCLRHELFALDTALMAYATPQVCYLEKMLQLHISPQAVINPHPVDVVMWRDDEPLGTGIMIDDTVGQLFYMDAEFGLAEFTVLLPAAVSPLLPYARQILDANKLPGTAYTILLR